MYSSQPRGFYWRFEVPNYSKRRHRGRSLPRDWKNRWLRNPEPPFREERQPKIPWSRPFSALAAGNVWFDPPKPAEIKSPKLLVVGGTYDFIPDWIIHGGISIKHFENSGKNFYEALGDFEPDAILIFVKATTGHTKHQTFDYGKQHKIPILILHSGWGELILDARKKRVGWLSDIYPHKIWVPKEYYERQKAKRERARRRKIAPSAQLLAFSKKRRHAFAVKGITDGDAQFAKTRYVRPAKSKCSLCGTKIKYQFGIDFTLPGEEEIVSFYPVGSTCIRAWLADLPDSEYKDRIRAQAEEELAKAEPAKALSKKVIGRKTPKAKLSRRKKTLPKPRQTELFDDLEDLEGPD